MSRDVEKVAKDSGMVQFLWIQRFHHIEDRKFIGPNQEQPLPTYREGSGRTGGQRQEVNLGAQGIRAFQNQQVHSEV